MAGSGVIVVEMPVHVPKSPVVGAMFRAAIEALLMGTLMGARGVAVKVAVPSVVAFVAIVITMCRSRRGNRHHGECGGRNKHKSHLGSPGLRSRRGSGAKVEVDQSSSERTRYESFMARLNGHAIAVQ